MTIHLCQNINFILENQVLIKSLHPSYQGKLEHIGLNMNLIFLLFGFSYFEADFLASSFTIDQTCVISGRGRVSMISSTYTGTPTFIPLIYLNFQTHIDLVILGTFNGFYSYIIGNVQALLLWQIFQSHILYISTPTFNLQSVSERMLKVKCL